MSDKDEFSISRSSCFCWGIFVGVVGCMILNFVLGVW